MKSEVIFSRNPPGRFSLAWNADRPTFLLLAVGFSWLLLSESASHLQVTSLVSLNLVATAVFLVSVVTVLLISGRVLPVFVVISLMAVGISTNVLNDYPVASAQYLLTLAALAVTSFLVPNTYYATRFVVTAFVIALCGAWYLVVATGLGFHWYGRAGHTVAPLIVLTLLVFGERLGKRALVVGFLSALATMSAVTLSTSRMATAIGLTLLVGWLIAFCPWRKWLRAVGILLILVAEYSFWTLNPWARERVFGRDASVRVGALRINGEGRSEASAILQTSDSSEPDLLARVFGEGIGAAQNFLMSAGFILDKPHNEFIRLHTDAGFFGIAAWTIFILGLLGFGIARIVNRSDKASGQVLVGLALILTGFSYSDNPLSYSWVLIPTGVLIAWARSNSKVASATRHRSDASSSFG